MDEAVAGKYLTELNRRLRKGWTAHLSPEGRIFYMNHETKISSWQPPVESWDSGGTGLPYGWEIAIDKEGKTYYVNHANKTTTYENPRKDVDEEPPQPREVELARDPQMGFGFVAGSEKPVIVRFVTEGGPNEQKLMPGDQILKINDEDVMRAPRERVIELIRSCKHSVKLLVCQPQTNDTTRKSALLTAAKKAKLKNNPARVRFSEGVVINGSPLYSPSPMDSHVPFLPNVLKVFLENGQTKSFKYDSTTTVQDVLKSLFEKLSLQCIDHFSLATEHVKITRKNRLTVLDPKDTIAKIAARPGAHHLRCVFRVSFVPKDAHDLLRRDPVSFEYLYVQCCNDVVQERFAPELKYDIALRLAALHIVQHCLSSGMQGKISVKAVERECGLERFVPVSLMDSMKRKELRKLLTHFLKQNQSMCPPGQKHLTALQAKLHYLKIIGELPMYGSKCFSTNLKDSNPETAVLVSPRFGLSQVACLRNTIPLTLAHIEELSDVTVTKEDEISSAVEIFLKDPSRQSLNFSMEDRDTEEFILLLKGYFRLLCGKELSVQWDRQSIFHQAETVPCFHNRHTVREAPWSYPPTPNGPDFRTLDLSVGPPPYFSYESRQLARIPSQDKIAPTATQKPVDHNMNEAPAAGDQVLSEKSHAVADERRRSVSNRGRIDERHPGIDYRSVISMELLEDSSGDIDVDVYEAKNDEVIRRLSDMSKILSDAESYLMEGGTRVPAEEARSSLKPADSLLLLSKEEERKQPEEEISPSESDTDSTPNDSPLHRTTAIRNSINPSHPMLRRDSSFGLHSPDLLPNISSGNNILDILKHLQTEEVQLPFAEGTLYLDPDIIDLTMIPPPITPDTESQGISGSPLDAPPTAFLDAVAIHKELEKWMSIPKELVNELEEQISTFSIGDSDKGMTLYSQTGLQNLSTCRGSTLGVNQFLEGLSSSDSEYVVTDGSVDDTKSLDSFIESLTIPSLLNTDKPLDGNVANEDLSLYIIPPPPSSSPSTEAQNEVIAKFQAAAEEMKRMFEGDDIESQSGFRELQQFWSEIKSSDQNCCGNLLLGLENFDTLNCVADSGSYSGDSSGYDTLTSSLTSYSDDGIPTSPSANSSESTPVYERSPSDLPVTNSPCRKGIPVAPRLRTSCVDDVTSPLSITSPSSTTSSDSSVILLEGLETHESSKNIRPSDFCNSQNICQAESCDNLVGQGRKDSVSPCHSGLARSASWSSIANAETFVLNDVDESNEETKEAKAPQTFHQNRLRRSFMRGSLTNAVVPCKTSHSSGEPCPDPINSRNSKVDVFTRIGNNSQINGLTIKCEPAVEEEKCSICINTKCSTDHIKNGCIQTNGHLTALDEKALVSDEFTYGPFEQAQKDISAMVVHLMKISQMPSKSVALDKDPAKFHAAKEALVNESRQFVTSSKLFVKSAMESSKKLIENMAICVALLNRMTAICELVVMRSATSEHHVLTLVGKLKEVAVTYLYTVEAAHRVAGPRTDPSQMGTLMQSATTLATALTSLMRTLRALSNV